MKGAKPIKRMAKQKPKYIREICNPFSNRNDYVNQLNLSKEKILTEIKKLRELVNKNKDTKLKEYMPKPKRKSREKAINRIPDLNTQINSVSEVDIECSFNSLAPLQKVDNTGNTLKFKIKGRTGEEINCIIDTGAAENVFPYSYLKYFRLIKKIEKIRLATYSGGRVNVVLRGVIHIYVPGFGGAYLPVSFVTQEGSIGLLGLPFLKKTQGSIVQISGKFYLGFKISYETDKFMINTLENVKIKANSFLKKKIKISDNWRFEDPLLKNLCVKESKHIVPCVSSVEKKDGVNYLFLILENNKNRDVMLRKKYNIKLERNVNIKEFTENNFDEINALERESRDSFPLYAVKRAD